MSWVANLSISENYCKMLSTIMPLPPISILEIIGSMANHLTYEGDSDAEPDNLLREKRKAAGLTQKELEALTGFSSQKISHIEKGIRKLQWIDAKKIAPHVNCSPAELFPGAVNLSIPLRFFVATAISDNAPESFEIEEPAPRIAAPATLKAPQNCFAAHVLDDSVDRFYPANTILSVRELGPLPVTIAIGAKILIRRKSEGKTFEVLVGLLDHVSTGDLVLHVRSTNGELPGSITIQHAPRDQRFYERFIKLVPHVNQVEYMPAEDDPAEILGIISMASTPE